MHASAAAKIQAKRHQNAQDDKGVIEKELEKADEFERKAGPGIETEIEDCGDDRFGVTYKIGE
jgi:hypothetical protein